MVVIVDIALFVRDGWGIGGWGIGMRTELKNALPEKSKACLMSH